MSRIIKKDSNSENKTDSFKSFINFATNFDEDISKDNQEKTFEFEKVDLELDENEDTQDEILSVDEENQEFQEILDIQNNSSQDKTEENEVLSLMVKTQMKEVEILNKAKEEALAITQSAKDEAESIKAKAYSVGFDSGKQDGFKQGKKDAYERAKVEVRSEVDELKYNVAREIKLLDIEKDRILEKHIEELKEISISIGEKIALTSFKSSKDIIEKMILEATEKMKKSSWAKIYIGHTDEAVNIKGDAEFLEKLSRLADNVKVIIMQADEDGTCIIETPNGTMDISVKTQVDNIRDIIKGSN